MTATSAKHSALRRTNVENDSSQVIDSEQLRTLEEARLDFYEPVGHQGAPAMRISVQRAL
jgi:hypothetical protein